jgi:serine/threonine protein kinase/tetratricopeptide (TPR) repeat protein
MLDLYKGQTLSSRFLLVEKLGQGRASEVWLAEDQGLETQVALKIFSPELFSDPNLIDLIKNECRTARTLTHPNIVTLYDFHLTEFAFISMAFSGRDNLDGHLRQTGHLSEKEAIEKLLPVANALSYAHQSGVVHRDLKATNVLFNMQGEPLLTDFGMAAIILPGKGTMDSDNKNALAAMSPQQLQKVGPDPADDLYGFGALLYEVLSGQPLFYPDITADKILHAPPMPVNRILAGKKVVQHISPDLDELINRLLLKDPLDRPARMEDVIAALQQVLQGYQQAFLPTQKPTTSSFSRDRQKVSSVFEPPPQSDQPKKIPITFLVLLAIVVLGAGMWGVQYLMRHPVQMVDSHEALKPKMPPVESPPVPAPPAADLLQQKKLELARQEAENALGDYLRIKNELDAKGVVHWGGADYQAALQIGAAAEAHMLQKDFEAAAKGFVEATNGLGQVSLHSADALKQALADGTLALAHGEGESARQHFKVALMIDPDNSEAQKKWQRAQKIEEVMRLIAAGDTFEQEGNLTDARDAYQKALALDSESDAARQALDQIRDKIRLRRFQDLMSQGMAALHNQKLARAQQLFLKARKLNPGSRAVQDALLQVDSAMRLAQIEQLQKKASAAEQTEHWAQAVAAYQQVLALDANIQFAVQGLQRTQKLLQLSTQVQHFIENPSILASDRGLDEAKQLLQEAQQHAPSTPIYQKRLQKLDKTIASYQTPVKLTITSDNATQVAVYKIGRLGAFQRKELSLRPGNYTIVGSRIGYKDVRHRLQVKPGTDTVQINVICKELI